MKPRNIILLFMITLAGSHAYCQDQAEAMAPDQCRSSINAAGQLYSNGYYDKCIDILEPVIRTCKLARKDKEEAMELLTKAYVEVQDLANAETMALRLLKKFPHYELNENENFEGYNRLIKKYSIHPAITIGIRNTGMWNSFTTTRVYTVPEGPTNQEPYLHDSYSFMYYGWGELEFNRGISLNGDLMWWTASYYRNLVKPPDLDIYFSETREYVEIPVYLKKYFYPMKNLLPYVAGGIGWLYMTKANGYCSRMQQGDNTRYYDENIELISMRNRNTFEWLAGAGVGYKLKNIRMFLDIRYYRGINSFTNPAHRYDVTFLQDDYFYIDNSVKMNKFEIGASISYTLKNSVKKIRYKDR